jgi:hypothetical protein
MTSLTAMPENYVFIRRSYPPLAGRLEAVYNRRGTGAIGGSPVIFCTRTLAQRVRRRFSDIDLTVLSAIPIARLYKQPKSGESAQNAAICLLSGLSLRARCRASSCSRPTAT